MQKAVAKVDRPHRSLEMGLEDSYKKWVWERKIEATDRQKWSRIMGSHRLPRSIPHPHPISHCHYECHHERLTVMRKKKEGKKNTTVGSSWLQSCSLLLHRHAGVHLFWCLARQAKMSHVRRGDLNRYFLYSAVVPPNYTVISMEGKQG